MASDRRQRTGKPWVILLWVAALGFPPTVVSGEYYSWIDPSGTMVLTNDPSNIPPASKRSPVAVHHYEDSPASAAPAPAPPPMPSAGRPAMAASNPANLNLPGILLDTPDPSVQFQYNWVPLASPIYLGSGTVSGFWCLRTVAVPLQAFKLYLQNQGWSGQNSQAVAGQYPWFYGHGRHYRRFWGGNQGWGTQGYGNLGSVYNQTLGQIQGMQAQVGTQFNSNHPVYNQTFSEIQGMQAQVGSQINSGHPVYDQVMLERQAMNQQLSARFGAGMQAPPHCCAGGFGHAGGGHR